MWEEHDGREGQRRKKGGRERDRKNEIRQAGRQAGLIVKRVIMNMQSTKTLQSWVCLGQGYMFV